MKKTTLKTKKIRAQILKDVVYHSRDIANHISELFDISRQSANRHLKALVEAEFLSATGSTKARFYQLGINRKREVHLPLKGLQEYEVYHNYFKHIIEGLPNNVEEIVFYGFTEILNNAIDHSNSDDCELIIERSAKYITLGIKDSGEGIFKKITREKNLNSEQQALLELSKGKLTTDPENHSGQGIFFTSRSFDSFLILSYGMEFTHTDKHSLDILVEKRILSEENKGTQVIMQIPLNSTRKLSDVFDQYSAGEEDDYSFNKTIIPVRLARYASENLVSRSQAKRLLTRIENFQYVVMDFEGVETIGQAFADEIFRVYTLRHPEINISFINSSLNIEKMINRAQNN